MIKSVIFDMDGTLIDTEKIVLDCWKYVIDKYKLNFDLSLPMSAIGMNKDSVRELFRSRLGDDFDFDKFSAEKSMRFHKITEADGIPVKTGFYELMRYLEEKGITAFVATSTSHDTAVNCLKKTEIWQYFDGLIGGDEITNSKPHPEIFNKAITLTGNTKDECLIVEDSENGIKAAVSTGAKSIFIRDINDIPELLKKGIYCECGNLAEIIKVIKKIK